MAITYKTREQVYAGITVDTEKRMYDVPYSTLSGSSRLPFEGVERRVNQFTEWLLERNYTLPPIPECGTVAYYVYQEELMDIAYVHCQSTGEKFLTWLKPELIGYEGKTIEVVDKLGETQRFKLGVIGEWALQHVRILPGEEGSRPVIGEPFQSIKVVTGELPETTIPDWPAVEAGLMSVEQAVSYSWQKDEDVSYPPANITIVGSKKSRAQQEDKS